MSATNALELGIDVGALDCVISVGFPGTVASLRQQWGRAGRREHGLAVLVASEDALDQYFMREPKRFSAAESRLRSSTTGTRVSSMAMSPRPPSRPRSTRRTRRSSVRRLSVAQPSADLEQTRRATSGRAATTPRAGSASARRVRTSSRSSRLTPAPCSARSNENEAYTTVREGAIYLHLGESYRVVALDLAARSALVEPFAGDYYTQTKETTTAIEEPLRTERRLGLDRLRPRQRHRR